MLSQATTTERMLGIFYVNRPKDGVPLSRNKLFLNCIREAASKLVAYKNGYHIESNPLFPCNKSLEYAILEGYTPLKL